MRTALEPTTATQVTLEAGRPIDLVIEVEPTATTSVEQLRKLPVGIGTKVALGTIVIGGLFSSTFLTLIVVPAV